MAKYGHTDSNQAQIVLDLRSAGAFVHSLHTVGSGCPDILVGFRGHWYVMEIKTAKGRIRPGQVEWWNNAEHVGIERLIVRNGDEALRAIGAIV